MRPQSHQRHGSIEFYEGTGFLITFSSRVGGFAKTVALFSIYRRRLYKMYSSILISLLLHLTFSTPIFGQYHTTTAPAAAATSSLTPADMSASSVSSVFASLATATPQQQNGEGGGPGDASSSGGTGNAAGASGSDTTSFSLSKGGLIAIIVVVVAVAVFGSMYPVKNQCIIPLTRFSCLDSALLSCEEEVLGSSSNDQEICEESGDSADTTAV